MAKGTRLAAACGAAALACLALGGAEARVRVIPGCSPTNGQEVYPDLSNPGVDGVIRIRSRIPGRMIRRLEEGMEEEPLLTLRDGDLEDVPFLWTWDPAEQVLELQPGLPMPSAQYTVNLTARFLGRRARIRGLGRDFSSSFTVGPDVHAPVLLGIRPGEGALDVRRISPVVVTFNESLEFNSVVLGETVHVENLSVAPPAPLPGTVFLDRDGFDLVFRPDPGVGLPAASIVGVRLLGVGNPSFVRDAAGNGLAGDPGDGNQLRFHFSTRNR